MHFFWPNFGGQKIDVVSIYCLMQFQWKTDATLTCLFWCIFERKILGRFEISFDKFFIYQMQLRSRVLFQSSLFPLYNIFGDYTVFKNIYKRWYLI